MKQRLADIDRGWAWVVLIAVYLAVIVNSTTLYMNGILYVALLDRYHEGEAKTSLIGAFSNGLLCFAAPIGSVINNIHSCRLSILIGGVLATSGIALSSVVPNLNWMIVTSGIIAGFGYGITSSGIICALGLYFKKWRDLVLSLAFLNVGFAMFLSAPLGLHLIRNFGLTSTYLIIASIQAHICVIGVICKPSEIEKDVHRKKANREDGEMLSKSKKYLDLTLLKNAPYMCFLCSNVTWNFALTVAIIHLSNYITVLGGSDSDITYVMSSFSVANIVGRLAGSIIISKLHHKSIYVYVICLAVTGLLSSLFPLYSKLGGGVYIFTIQLGIFTGLPNALMTPVSLTFVSVSKLSDAYGLTSLFCGIGVSAGPVLIGYLYSITGSYENSFLVAGR